MERFKGITTILLLAFAVLAWAAQTKPASVLLQEGLYAEQIEGNLEAAIKLYERIVKDFPKDRPVAAKALLHIGLSYEKLGKQEAQKAYQQLIQQFSDQQEVVAEARTRLSRLTRLASAVQAEDIVIRKFMDGVGPGLPSERPSPDGKYFAFVDWRTYPHDIVIKEIGTGEEIRLRSEGDLSPEGHVGIPYFLTWSPDSKKIAYTWENDEGHYIELRVIEIDNPQPVVLTRVDYFNGWVTAKDWSPDGQHILVLHSENDQDQLGLISIADKSFHLLKKLDDYMSSAAKFSPGGHHIAYDLPPNKENANHDIYVLSVDGTREIKLTSHPSHDYLIDWSPTGKKILFASDRTGTMDVWSISFGEGAPQGEPKLITRNIGLIKPLGCTRKGSFYYSTPGSWWDIYTVTIDPKTGKIAEPPTEAPLPYQGYNKHPAWSPNGKYLAYVSMRDLERRKNILCIHSVETGASQEFTYKHNITFPHWFPDGQSMLLNSSDGTHLLKMETGQITPFIQEEEGQGIAPAGISPDNRYLYYVRGDEKSGVKSVIRRDLKTEKEEELYRTTDDALTTALSPDGKQLALLSRHKENTRILKILSTVNGSEKDIHEFKLKEYRYISIAWSPDGRYIYFSKGNDSEDKWELCRIPAAGGTAENLGVKMHRFVNISIHPDGRRITFASFVGFERPGGIWVMENFLPKAEKPSDTVVRRVWADAADPYFMGAPSPNGKYLSYVDWGTGDLAVHDLASGKNRRLTSEGWSKGRAGHSIFSPDSKCVACRWRSRGGRGLRIIGLDGAERRLIKHPEGITILRPTDWSPDGKHILALGGAVWDDSEGAFRFLKILFVSVEDDDVRVLKTIERPPHHKRSGQFRMSLSPDGRYVAYSFPPADNSGNGDIWVFGTDGGPEIQVVEHPADDFVLGWAPDGKQVVFASDRTGSMGIWAVEVADGKTQGTPQLLKPEIGRFHPLGLTQKGSYYYGVFSGGSNVYTATFDPQEGNVAGKPVVTIKQYEGSNWAPDWSPDGRYLACVSASPGASPVFLIHSVKSGEVRKLSPDLKDFNVHSLRWAPDGRSLLGAGKTQDMSWGVLKIDVETGAVTTIVEGPGIFGPNWAADGKTVFYVCNLKTNGGIIRHDLATGEKKELYSASGFIGAALALSPDGRQLAFYDIQGGALKVLSATGGEPRELVKVEGKISIAWTPDGRHLVYGPRGLGEGPAQLWRIPAEGGEPQRLDLEMAYLGHIRFRPDGRHIAFMGKAEKDKCEVWVMENILPELSDRQ